MTPTDPARPFLIAVEQFGDATWTGGAVYHQNLFQALAAHRRTAGADRPAGVETALLYRSGQARSTDLADRYIEVRSAGRFRLARRVVHRTLGRYLPGLGPTAAATRALAAAGVDALFTTEVYPASLAVPVVGWIPDFQHLHLPGMATPEYVAGVTRRFADVAARADVVLLSSPDARRDFQAVMPEHLGKVHVVPFVSTLAGARADLDPKAVADRYGLPDRFFLVPNQFWQHKDHATVLRALQALRRRRPDLVVVATGHTHDNRTPHYFPSLLGEIATRGVHGTFRMLGLIPRGDLFALYRRCLAVVQPSRFEGWSTSIEEAKSIGKPVVASDLPVHREQVPDGRFFPPGDADALADRLAEGWDDLPVGPDPGPEAEAAARLPDRVDAFARQFIAAATAAAAARKGSRPTPV